MLNFPNYASLEKKTFISVSELVEAVSDELEFKVIAGKKGLGKHVVSSELDRPGLALAGYIERFAYKRIQILGLTEISYLKSLTVENRQRSIHNLLRFWAIPCIIVSKNLEVPVDVLEAADQAGTPIIHSNKKTEELKSRLRNYLEVIFAPADVLHGTLVSVFGIGMLLTGRAGIGKSECALELVERGHRFIADDMVLIKKFPNGSIWGYANNRLKHTMEIRGIGVVDVRELFGLWRVGLKKEINLIVELIPWKKASEIERTGLITQTQSLLEVEVPMAIIPVSPGKNLTVISEVIAMNFIQRRIQGIDAANKMEKELIERLLKKGQEIELKNKNLNKNK